MDGSRGLVVGGGEGPTQGTFLEVPESQGSSEGTEDRVACHAEMWAVGMFDPKDILTTVWNIGVGGR